MVLDPSDLGVTIVVAPGQMPGNFLSSPDADCLSFVVKLVHACVTVYPCFDFSGHAEFLNMVSPAFHVGKSTMLNYLASVGRQDQNATRH